MKRVCGMALVLSLTFTLCGCSSFHKLDLAYDFANRTELYETRSSGGRAEPFAHNLCVVMEDTPGQDDFVTAEAAAVFDLEDQSVVFGDHPFERLYPASITKIMTALLAIKYGDLSEVVTVPPEAVITESGATLCGISPGDQLTLEQLLYGLMLPSGNDAGAAIAIHMDESIEAFAKRMNQEAQKLGATGTHFMNPHGLHDENHYTTAYDLYLIFNEALTNEAVYPEFLKVIGAPTYKAVYKDAEGGLKEKTWKSTNWYLTGDRALPDDLSLLGGKTGTTAAAGSCLIVGTQDPSGKQYISVVLKAPDRNGLYDNMSNILHKIVD